MEPHFSLTFGTSMGSTRTLRINNINPDVSDDTMRDAMDSLILTNLVAGETGAITAPRRASLVESSVRAINLG